MSFPVPTFWKLAIDSQLFTPAECKQLGEKFAQKKGSDDVGVLTAWLISRGALSRYQGEVLLAGRAGPFVYGDYKIYDRVESKRFARMFRAVHMPTKQRVCLYFLAGAGLQDSDTIARLAHEGALANRASMGFPHLLRTYEFADQGSFKFVVIEDMQGKRLERVLSKGPLPPADACRMVRQAALGLARLYALGMTHGEIRPANLWLDPNGTLKLIHFPLSRDPLDETGSAGLLEAAQDESIPPEADFLAPELAQGGRQPDMRSDIYSLGCTLYQMLTGKVPFPGGDLKDKLIRHATETPRPVDQVNSAIPAALAKAVSFMLAKNPDLRFQHTNNVIEALLPFLEPGASQSPQIPVTAISQAYENWLAANGKGSAAATSSTPPQTSPLHTTPKNGTPKAVDPKAPAAKPAAAAPAPPPAPVAPQPPAAPMPQPAMAVPAAWPAQAAPMAMAVPAMAAYPAAPRYPSAAQPAMAVPAYAAPMHAQMAPMAHAMPAQVMSAPDPEPAAAPAAPRRASSMANRTRRAKQSQKNNLIAAGVGAAILLIGGIVLWQAGAFGGSSAPVATTEGNNSEGITAAPNVGETPKKTDDDKKGVTKSPTKTAAKADDKLRDVGESPLWVSPTSGQRINVKYLSPMSHAVVALRPADLLKSSLADGIFDSNDPEGIGRVIGPLGQMVMKNLPVLAGTTPDKIKQVILGILDGMGGPYKTSLVIRYEEAIPGDELITAWGNPTVVMIKDSQGKEHNIYQLPDRMMYVPENEKGLVVAVLPVLPPEQITEYLDMMLNNSYSFGPDLELMMKASDEDRLFTCAFPGNFLTVGAGQDLFAGVAARLKEPLNAFLAVNDAGPAKAVMLSMHLNENFFMELRVIPPVGQNSTVVAKEFHDRVAALPRQIKLYVNGLFKTPYSNNVLIDFDEMMKAVPAYTRAGADDEQIVLRTYLPPKAAQHLALCTYTSLQEGYGGGAATQTLANTGPKSKTFDDKLNTKIDMVFNRNPLEVTMQLLSEALGIEIQILGSDLQLDGITKNQSSGMDEKNKPGRDILLGFLGRAHPKLVYFTKPKEGSPGDEVLYISSVSGVTARLEKKEQLKLPPEFAALAKPKK